jgi:excisionase family DNA binding protein
MGTKITINAAANELGISKRTLWRLISRGELRAYRIGQHSVRIDVDDLESVCTPIVPR